MRGIAQLEGTGGEIMRAFARARINVKGAKLALLRVVHKSQTLFRLNTIIIMISYG